MFRPVGPHSAGVYWVRRALVAAVGTAVVIAAAWFVVGQGSGPGTGSAAADAPRTTSRMTGVLPPPATGGPTDSTSSGPGGSSDSASGETRGAATPTSQAATTTNTTTTKAATAKTTAKTTTKATAPKTTAPPTAPKTTTNSTAKSTAPKTTAPPTPSYDADGRLLCPDSAIAIVATTGAPSYPSGSQPILGMTVTNTGSKPCVRDLSGPLQVYTVYNASGKRMWSTDDCFPGVGSDVRELVPGRSVTYNIKWAGTTSTPGCATPRVPVAAGGYTLVANVGPLKSPPRPFTVTG